MKSYDFEAVTYDGAVYCTECLPKGVTVDSEEVSPVFADSEWDYVPCCDACGAEHDYVTVLEDEDDEDEDEEEDYTPSEGDLVTYDHEYFYEVGSHSAFDVRLHRNVRVAVEDGEDWRTAVLAYMDKQQFWPNVWFISDHGNVSLLSLAVEA